MTLLFVQRKRFKLIFCFRLLSGIFFVLLDFNFKAETRCVTDFSAFFYLKKETNKCRLVYLKFRFTLKCERIFCIFSFILSIYFLRIKRRRRGDE